LREELADYPFRSDCDTEVIIAAYLAWGISCVERFNGMFAIALYDREDETVYLIRDRIGKKPLYYWYQDGELVFASELKPIMACPDFPAEIDRGVLSRFLFQKYINAPESIYRNVCKLEPGAILSFQGGQIRTWKYWSVSEIYREAAETPVAGYEEAKEQLKALLKRAVSLRMIADVPLGSFLSGGYDSSLVCALMQENSLQKIRTYCMGFEDSAFDERGYAERVANHLGTEHRNLCISDKEMLDTLECSVKNNALPIADYAVIPTIVMASEAKKDNDIILTGVGGDELFMGGLSIYAALDEAQKHALTGKIIYYSRKVPLLKNIKALNNLPFNLRLVAMDQNKKAATQIGAYDMFHTIKRMLNQPVENNSFYFEIEDRYPEKNYGARRSLVDLDSYTVELELLKEDSATMRAGIERRCPIYDKKVMEYVFRMPYQFKMQGDGGKRILRDVLYEYVPRELVDRPKSGFNIPAERLLNTYLKDELLELSSSAYLRKQGLFHPEHTSEIIRDYLKPEKERKMKGHFGIVWTFYIYQKWYREWMNEMGN